MATLIAEVNLNEAKNVKRKQGHVLKKAIFECERFLQAAKAYTPESGCYIESASAERAAAKRASLDASRALSALRKASSSEWAEEV